MTEALVLKNYYVNYSNVEYLKLEGSKITVKFCKNDEKLEINLQKEVESSLPEMYDLSTSELKVFAEKYGFRSMDEVKEKYHMEVINNTRVKLYNKEEFDKALDKEVKSIQEVIFKRGQ